MTFDVNHLLALQASTANYSNTYFAILPTLILVLSLA